MLPYALVGSVDGEHDGVVGEDNEDQGDVAEPAPPLLDAVRARVITAGLREAMDDVRRTVAVLATRVRDAHTARVWVPLGYPGWEAYCDAEFGISRAQAYRLLDVARALGAIQAAVDAGTAASRTRHRPGRRGRARLRPVPARPYRRRPHRPPIRRRIPGSLRCAASSRVSSPTSARWAS